MDDLHFGNMKALMGLKFDNYYLFILIIFYFGILSSSCIKEKDLNKLFEL